MTTMGTHILNASEPVVGFSSLLTRVNTGAGIVSFNTANASFPPRKSSGGFPPAWRLVRHIAAVARP